MNKIAILTLYKREMLDILRDKKTVFMNVFVPIILIPLITIGAAQVMMSVQSSLDSQDYNISLVGSEEATSELEQVIENTNPTKDAVDSSAKKDSADTATANGSTENHSSTDNPISAPFSASSTTQMPSQNNLSAIIVASQNPEQDLKDKKIDAYIEVQKNENQLEYKIHFISSNVNSSSIASDLVNRLEHYKEEKNIQKLAELGVDYPSMQNEILIERTDHATNEQTIGNLLGGIIPLLLILGLVNGAAHTAIDTTAGEKERGTLETTFSFPVTRKEIITSKFFAVATMAFISVLLNILSIALMGSYTASLLGSLAPDQNISVNFASYLPVLFILFVCVLLFAIFVSAFSLSVFSMAQSPKEANLYATPIVLVATLVSYIGLIPNAELSVKTAILPIVNIVLLTKSIFVFEYDITLILITFASNLLYSLLAIQLMFSVFEREDILFGENSRFLRILEKRANIKAGGTPSIGEAVFLLILGIIGLVFIGGYFQLKFGFFGVLSIQVWILFLAVGFAFYAKFDFKEVFSIRAPHPLHLLGAASLWLGTLMCVALLSIVLTKYFPESVEGLELMEDMLKEQTLPALLLVVAIAPAICEEIFFRGFVYSAFGKKFRPAIAILIVSALFGVYHLSVIKFFTTGILGIAINYALYKTKSIFPSMLIHFLNNATSVIVIFFQEKLMQMSGEQMSAELSEAEMMSQANPVVALIFIVLFLGAGIFLLNLGQKKDITV